MKIWSLSSDVPTLFSSDFEQILGQIVSLSVKTLRNTNLVVSRRFRSEKGPLPFDVRRSKTSLLNVPNMQGMRNAENNHRHNGIERKFGSRLRD